MATRGILALLLTLAVAAVARAQDATRPASAVALAAGRATNWVEGGDNVLLLEEGVTITAGDARLSAEAAVVWLTKIPGTPRRRADVVLLGNASLTRGDEVRTGPTLAVDLVLDDRPRQDFARRVGRDASADPLYQRALPLRPTPTAEPPPIEADEWAPEVFGDPAEPPARTESRAVPVVFQAGEVRTEAADGKLAVVADGGVFVLRREDDGGLIELRGDAAVLFTDVTRLDDLAQGPADALASRAVGVYLEGDVRAVYTPAGARDADAEQRLTADRLYYDLRTDRATLTDAVLHTGADAGGRDRLPLTVRAKVVRQLSRGEYEARGAEITTSRFATPSYSLNAGRVFVRREPADGGDTRTVFGGDNLTARLFGVPVFYFPVVRGSTVDGRLPIRSVSVGQERSLGPFVLARFGLFETLGATPPRDADASYTVGYLGDRGPTAALDFDYGGEFVLPLTLDEPAPSLYRGEIDLDAVYEVDGSFDELPGNRPDAFRDGLRVRFEAEHLQFFPGGAARGGTDYALFARLGVLPDATYLEQFDAERFREGPAHDATVSLERRRGGSRLAVTVAGSPNSFPTVADRVQENAYVRRLPELEYGVYGRRLGPVALTSRNRLGLMQFDRLSGDLADEFNFRGGVGLPSYGYTGDPEKAVPRLDSRQEVSAALDLGPVRAVPFVVGRVTAYGDSPGGDATARALAGGGMRIGTTFARVDDAVYSRILDLDRARHLVEPYASVFAGVANFDGPREGGGVYVYDEGVDDYGGGVAGRAGVRQRWQTYRGPPGGKRGVDVIDLDVGVALFDGGADELDFPGGGVDGLRGAYFGTLPEASLPRDTADARGLWRVTDTTALVGEAAVTLDDGDRGELSTAAAGLVARRGDRLGYSLGGRYVRPLDETLVSAAATYELSERYRFVGGTRVDVEEGRLRNSVLTVQRRFERSTLAVTFFLDEIDDDRGVSVVLTPRGIGGVGLGTDTLGAAGF